MREGYHWQGPLHQANVAFFPLYPLLGKLVDIIVHNDKLALFLISNFSFVAFCLILYRFIKNETNQRIALKTIFYLCLFPLSFVFSATYTESLFLLLVVSCLFLGRKKHWFWAAIFGFLASLTRFNGLVLFFVLPVLYKQTEKVWKKNLLWLLLIPLGTLLFIFYLQFKVGDGLAFYKVLAAWKILTVPPWILILEMLKFLFLTSSYSYFFAIAIFDLLTVILFIFLLLFARNRLTSDLFLYSFLMLIMALTKMWNPLFFYPAGSVSRYLMEAFPLFLVLAKLGKNPFIHYLYIFLCAILLGPLALSFFTGLWVF